MQRYFLENVEINNNTIYIDGSDFHHIKNVMRMKIDDLVYVCFDSLTYVAKISLFLNDKVAIELVEKLDKDVELKVDVTIAHGLVRREKMEEVIRRICELGAHEYIPVSMARSIVKVKEEKDSKLQRQKTIIKEACEQSHRNRLMEISGVVDFKKFLVLSKNYDLCLFAYEESGRSNNYNLKKYLKEFSGKKILVLVGPEGGFSENEVDVLEKNGFMSIGLGPRILRTETAPLYVMSAISYELEIGE